MSSNLHAYDAAAQFSSSVVQEWASQLATLLENKHLYQKVDASIDPLRMEIMASLMAGQDILFNQFISLWEKRPLKAAMTLIPETINISNNSMQVTSPILLVTNVKLFCSKCRTSEVFSPLWANDIAVDCFGPHRKEMPRNDSHQLFFLAFQCQRCNSDPNGFIVRRNGNRLVLEGRSPIEQVELPKYLPKNESVFFSDAIVAHNAGKKLAGLFYLRTFLEQFARRMTGKQGRVTGEDLMDAYTSTLPQAHRDHMPSFREWYEKLSVALHTAKEDDSLFESARSEIDRHFDIRRIFKIGEDEAKTEVAIAAEDSAPATK